MGVLMDVPTVVPTGEVKQWTVMKEMFRRKYKKLLFNTYVGPTICGAVFGRTSLNSETVLVCLAH